MIETPELQQVIRNIILAGDILAAVKARPWRLLHNRRLHLKMIKMHEDSMTCLIRLGMKQDADVCLADGSMRWHP